MKELADFGSVGAQALRHFRIVGEQQQAGVHSLHLVDGKEHLSGGIFDQVHHGPPSLLVSCSPQEVFGLVEQQVVLFFWLDALALHHHFIRGVNLRAQCGDHLTIDGDGTGGDQKISLTPHTNP